MKVGEIPETSDEIRFEDLGLIYMFSYDLGRPIGKIEDLKIEDLEKHYSSKHKLTEAIWTPSSNEPEFTFEFAGRKLKELGIKGAENAIERELETNERLNKELHKATAMFRLIVSKNYEASDPEYLELGRYGRLKLIDLNLRIEDPEFNIRDLGKELRCELYMLLHITRVAVVTVWIHLNGDLSVEDIIEIEEKKLYKAKGTIKTSLGEEFKEITLDDFIYDEVITPLQLELEKHRSTHLYHNINEVICIRKHRCQDGCMTAEDAVEKHPKEIYGIFKMDRDWRSRRTDIIEEELKNLSTSVDYAIFVANMLMANEVHLFIGSTALYKKLKSEEDQELAYREYELYLVLPTELLLLSTLVLAVYSSIYQHKFEEIKSRIKGSVVRLNIHQPVHFNKVKNRIKEEKDVRSIENEQFKEIINRIKEKKDVRSSEIVNIMEELANGVEGSYNISVFVRDPYRMVMEQGEERLSREVDKLKHKLQDLSSMARTFYEEESLRRQEFLSGMQTLLTFNIILLGVMAVIFQALQFLRFKAIDIIFAMSVFLGVMLIVNPYYFYVLIRARNR